jgi:hypothetical protein
MRVRGPMPEDRPLRPRGWAFALAGYVAIAGYLFVQRDLRAEVPAYLAGEMRDVVWMIAIELSGIALIWSARCSMSLAARSAITSVASVPTVLFVIVIGYLGGPHCMAIDLHVAWLGYAIAWSQLAGLVLPSMHVIYRGMIR